MVNVGVLCKNSSLAHFYTMATDKKEVKHCFYCGKEAKRTKKTIFCLTCKKSPKFSFPVDITPEKLEMKFEDDMIYCYNCGEELFKEEGVIICPDGCGLIDINKTADVTSNQERAITEPQGNSQKTVSSPTYSGSTSDPTGPGPPLEEKVTATPQNKTTSFTESNDDTSRIHSLQDVENTRHSLQPKDKLAQFTEKMPTEDEGNLEKQVQQQEIYSCACLVHIYVHVSLYDLTYLSYICIAIFLMQTELKVNIKLFRLLMYYRD